MSNSLVQAFRQVRLGGTNVTTANGKLQVGADTTVMTSESGQFASAAGLAALDTRLNNTGQNLLNQINALTAGGYMHMSGDENISGIKNFATQLQRSGSNVLTENQSGQFASAASVTALAAASTLAYVSKTNQTGLSTLVPTGVDNLFIPFGMTFSSIPKVQASVEVTGDITYFCAVRNRTTSGYTALLSDTVLEGGVYINTFATL